MLDLFGKYDRLPSLLLDFACGTGNFSVRFAKKGIEVIGVDRSEGMLSVAREKNYALKTPVFYLKQSGEELDLYGTVDGAFCGLDSLNHITDYEALKKCIAKISLFLERDRLFIFDVNTVYKHKEILGNNTFRIKKRGVDCIWANRLLEDGVTVQISLNFKYKTGFFKTEEMGESFYERAYTEEELESALNEAGFRIEAIFGEDGKTKPALNSQRNIYVVRKVK